MSRPRNLVVVAGTTTGVGKTWVAARVARMLGSRGLRVAARKPVQSFDPSEVGATDAELLAAATGAAPDVVCPPHRWYPLAAAPPMAAAMLHLPGLAIADVAAELAASWPVPAVDVGLVELAGGPRSPLADDGDGVDLMDLVRPDGCLLVADAGLGVINAVRLALGALPGMPVVVVLNRYDAENPLHAANLAWLSRCVAGPVVVSVAEVADQLMGASPGWSNAAPDEESPRAR
jgi:dethiobiotin synthetase